jgi:hypothetical protein
LANVCTHGTVSLSRVIDTSVTAVANCFTREIVAGLVASWHAIVTSSAATRDIDRMVRSSERFTA